jgi:hypothetical protein
MNIKNNEVFKMTKKAFEKYAYSIGAHIFTTALIKETNFTNCGPLRSLMTFDLYPSCLNSRIFFQTEAR